MIILKIVLSKNQNHHLIINYNKDEELTSMGSHCLHYTPHSSPSSRHCSNPNVVFSASIQSSQNSRG